MHPFMVFILSVIFVVIGSIGFLQESGGTLLLIIILIAFTLYFLGLIIIKWGAKGIVITIIILIIGFGAGYKYVSEHDLDVRVYKVTADSNYQTTERKGIDRRFYKGIPANSTIAWVYHTDSYPERGTWYVCYENKDIYIKLTDFDKTGDEWHTQYIKSITYKEFKNDYLK